MYGNFTCAGGQSPKLDRTVTSRGGKTSPALNQSIYSTLMSWFNRPNARLWARCPHFDHNIVRAGDQIFITPLITRAPEETPLIHKNPGPHVLLLFCSVAVAHHYAVLLGLRRSERWEVSRPQALLRSIFHQRWARLQRQATTTTLSSDECHYKVDNGDDDEVFYK